MPLWKKQEPYIPKPQEQAPKPRIEIPKEKEKTFEFVVPKGAEEKIKPGEPLPVVQLPKMPLAAAPKAEEKELEHKIQRILSEDIVDLYKNLPDEQKRVVLREGKYTIRTLIELVRRAKCRAKEIVELIRRWLQKIPGINRFFAEQEAKIKAQKIMMLRSKK